MTTKHVALFIDHAEARVFHIHPGSIDEATIKSPHHVHHKGPDGKDHSADPKHFFDEVAASLADSEEILVVGPSTGKLDFIRYAHRHAPALEHKIVGVETVDHPSDGQLVAHAKKYFDRADRMH
jgi:stalled ribosome rescue protein Dom34